jgi:hypothetical protein
MPCTGSLLKTIEGFIKPTQMARVARILKSRWLTHKNLLLENPM